MAVKKKNDIALQKTGPILFLYSADFLNLSLPLQKGRDEDTVESYRDTLTILKDYIADVLREDITDFRFSECTTEFVRNFITWLKESRGNCASTRNHRLACIKGYLEYACERDVSLTSVYSGVARIRPEKEEIVEKPVLDDKHVAAIMAKLPVTEKGIRNRIIILTLYETAVRVAELVDLEVSQLYLDRENPYILIHGKGKKERVVTITEEFSAVLKAYLDKHHDPDTPYVFYTTHKGKKENISVRSVQDIIKTYSDKAREENDKIPKGVHPHMFRRTRATALYQSGTPIEIVSSILGHAQIETTRVYAKPSMDQMREAIEKSIPESAYKKEPIWNKDPKEAAKQFGLR